MWSGLAGPRDADGEVSLAVEVTPDEVLEYQTAAQVTRCDGAPARLFPRAYDFEAGRFRPVVSPLPPPAPEKLVGHRGDPAMPAGRPVAMFHFTAASTTSSAGSDARDLTAPAAVDDGDPATAWTEGLGGDGRGEFLTARAGAGGAVVRGLRIVPGDAASAARDRARNPVRRLQLSLGPRDDQRFDVELPDAPADASRFREPFWVALPRPTPAACVTVVITEVAPGTEASPPKSLGATAISELAVFTDLDGPGGAERLVADVAHAADCASRVPALVGLGEAAVLPVAQAVMAAGARGATRECLVEALTRLEPTPKNPIVVEALVAAVHGATEKEERLVTAALRRDADPPVTALAKLLSTAEAPEADRARAARILAALDDAAATEALLTAVGHGPEPLRDAVVLALARAPRLDARLRARRHRRVARGGRRAPRRSAARRARGDQANARRRDARARRPARRDGARTVRSRCAAAPSSRWARSDRPRCPISRSCAPTRTSPCCATSRRAPSRRSAAATRSSRCAARSATAIRACARPRPRAWAAIATRARARR